MLGGVVQDFAHGSVDPAHDALDAVDRAEPVRLVDEVPAAGADEDVLAVVGDADDLVRHELADRHDGLPRLLHEEPVHLDAGGEIELALRNAADQLGGHLAQRDHPATPVVDVEAFARHAGEHALDLGRGHRRVRAGRGQHRHLGAGVKALVEQAGQLAGPGVIPRDIRRHEQHAPERAALPQLVEQSIDEPAGPFFGDDRLGGAFVEIFHDDGMPFLSRVRRR